MFEDETVALPDFTLPETQSWWRAQLANFTLTSGMASALGGIALTRNSPYFAQATCSNLTSEDDAFPYVPADVRDLFLSESNARTACPDATHDGGIHYALHNDYALRQLTETAAAAPEVVGADFYFTKHSRCRRKESNIVD